MLLNMLLPELLILVLEYLNFSDKLQFSIVCKKFYKLDYVFYLDRVTLLFLNKKRRIELNEIRLKYMKNKKKMSDKLKRLTTTLHKRKFDLNQIFVENIKYFEKNFNPKSHYVYSHEDEIYAQYRYLSREYNKYSLETEASSFLQYRIENLFEIFNIPNYDNIQYLLVENATLPKIPKNIKYLTMVSCTTNNLVLDNYKNLVFVKVYYFPAFPSSFYLTSTTKLHKLERLELTNISPLLLKNVHSEITIFDNVTSIIRENFKSTNLIIDKYIEEYSNLFVDISGSKILEEFKYKPNTNTLFFSKLTNLQNCTIKSKYLEDVLKNMDFLKLFESITIDASKKFYDSNKYSLELYDVSLKKLNIVCRSTNPYNKLPIIFNNIKADEVVIPSYHDLKVTNSNIKNIYVI